MTAIELNAQIWRDMAAIADSEPLMKQLAKSEPKVYAKTQTLSLAPPSALRGILVSGSSLSFV